MKKTLAIGIVIMLAIAGLAVYALTQDPNIITPFEKGEYGQEMVVFYSDGTSSSLKSTQIFPMYLFSAGKRITSIQYFLKAKFVGDYNAVDVNMLEYQVTFATKKTDGTGTEYQRIVNKNLFTPPSLAFKSGIYEKTDNYITLCMFSEVPANLILESAPDGAYTVTIRPQGTISYKVDGGNSVVATLPSSFSFGVTKAPGTLQIIWDQPINIGTTG